MKQEYSNECPLVTIIVPMYNVERYIGRCVDSLLRQTYNNIEIILVDDGSSDSTLKIVSNYDEGGSRIKLVHQNHNGPNIARANGLKLANGEFVMFVDSDDYIDEEAVEKLVKEFRKYGVDAIKFGSQRVGLDKKKSLPIGATRNKSVLKHDQVIKMLLTTYELNPLWAQAYRRKNLYDIGAFSYKIEFAEDFLVNLEIHQRTRNLLLLNDVLYYYNYNPESTSHSIDRSRILKNIDDRSFASAMAIKYASSKRFASAIKNEVIYQQISMVCDCVAIYSPRLRCAGRERTIRDLKKIFDREPFGMVDKESLNVYMKEHHLNRVKIINAVINSDYNYLWRYIVFYSLRNGFLKTKLVKNNNERCIK